MSGPRPAGHAAGDEPLQGQWLLASGPRWCRNGCCAKSRAHGAAPYLDPAPPPSPRPVGNNPEIGKLISDAMSKVGSQGVVTMEESRTAEDNLYFVEGMQFDRGFFSPYFVTDPERMVCGVAG